MLILISLRSPNAIPPLPNTKTQYFLKTQQSRTVSIPNHHQHHHNHRHHRHRGGSERILVSPDENETRSFVTKVDTTNLGPRRHTRRLREDDDDDDDNGRNEMKPFFRTGVDYLNLLIDQI